MCCSPQMVLDTCLRNGIVESEVYNEMITWLSLDKLFCWKNHKLWYLTALGRILTFYSTMYKFESFFPHLLNENINASLTVLSGWVRDTLIRSKQKKCEFFFFLLSGFIAQGNDIINLNFKHPVNVLVLRLPVRTFFLTLTCHVIQISRFNLFREMWEKLILVLPRLPLKA